MSLRSVRIALVLALCTVVSCGAGDAARRPPAAQLTTPTATPAAQTVVLPDGARIAVEVVSDPETRAQGLMFRSSLGRDHGMLFVFPVTEVYPFWMKNTLIPLDIIWIDEARKIVHIAHDMPPCKVDPCLPHSPEVAARYVLELAAGEARARGLREGDSLRLEGIENIVTR